MSGVTIRDFTGSESDYAAVVAIDNAVSPEYPDTVEEYRHADQSRAPHIKFRRFVAERAGAVVGFATYSQSEGMYHPRKFNFYAAVHPELQGQGVGAALFDHVVAALAPYDPLSLRAQTREDRQRSLRFLLGRGFAEDMRSWESRLDLASFDPAPFAGAEARALAAGISFAHMAELEGRYPDARQRLYELDIAASADEPHPEPITPISRESYDRWVFADPNYLPDGNFIALDGDLFVGMSTVRASQACPDELYVGFTGVRREYRGKGVAMALKLKAIAYARRRGAAQIKTWNASTNRPMLRINEALGFARQPAWVSLVKRLKEEES